MASLRRYVAATALVVIGAVACSKTPGRVGEACDPTDGCEANASCVSGTCFQLCASDTDCSGVQCRTLTSDDGQSFKACLLVDGGSASPTISPGVPTDTCRDTPLCSGRTIRSCSNQSGTSCYYLVDGTTKVPCASGCNCQAAAQQIVASNCK